MSKIITGTTFVLDDEPCFSLSEGNFKHPVDGINHRYQIIVVVRQDKLTEHRIDMGLSGNFHTPPIFMPGGDGGHGADSIVETVGRLRDVADTLRSQSETSFWEIALRNEKRE